VQRLHDRRSRGGEGVECGERIADRISVLYSDAPLALSTNFDSLAAYVGELRRAAMVALSEESVLISVEQVYHAV